jgi:signal transduction histidine kinase
MIKPRPPRLMWKIWLSASVVLTALFGVTGVILQRHALETTSRSLQDEVRASFQAYESLWKARSDTLGAVAAVMSGMPEVRSAFGTRHRATIRDTAGEVWLRIADHLRETAFFVVADPQGEMVTSLDTSARGLPASWPAVRAARAMFPRQVSGFTVIDGGLYQIVLNPVYVDSGRGPGLIVVLVAGYQVNHVVAQRLKISTGGSDFLFTSGDRVFASTLNDRATGVLVRAISENGAPDLVSDGVSEYVPLSRDLVAFDGSPIGRLWILRSFDGARARIRALQQQLVGMWFFAVTGGLIVSYVLVRWLIRPVEALDVAAAEIARQNYNVRVPVKGRDELARLSKTFNAMCESIQSARDELIRQERISTIGRMATSIVHDLRNPLAAIYGGAEMMVDTDLSPGQMKRVAANIYQASRHIQEMLQELLEVARGRAGERESCGLAEIVAAAVEGLRGRAESQKVRVSVDVPAGVELLADASRLERVFANLLDNALEVMPEGGEVRVEAREDGGAVEVTVTDSGPGISPEIRDRLFQPFVTHGKRTGLGLGLALARQTVLDHGGDMWAESSPEGGARFHIRLPLAGERQGVEEQPAAR